MRKADEETIADIVAQMREFGHQAAVVDNERVSPECLLYYADRLDAALAREAALREDDQFAPHYCGRLDAPGNAAAMRKALEFVSHMDDSPYTTYDVLVAIQKARAALSAPVRNCDVGTAEEQEDRFTMYCHSYVVCPLCPVKKLWNFNGRRQPSCAVLWAQMPYEAEGGEK